MGYELEKLKNLYGVGSEGMSYMGTGVPVLPANATAAQKAAYNDQLAKYQEDQRLYNEYKNAYMNRVMNTSMYAPATSREVLRSPVYSGANVALRPPSSTTIAGPSITGDSTQPAATTTTQPAATTTTQPAATTTQTSASPATTTTDTTSTTSTSDLPDLVSKYAVGEGTTTPTPTPAPTTDEDTSTGDYWKYSSYDAAKAAYDKNKSQYLQQLYKDYGFTPEQAARAIASGGPQLSAAFNRPTFNASTRSFDFSGGAVPQGFDYQKKAELQKKLDEFELDNQIGKGAYTFDPTAESQAYKDYQSKVAAINAQYTPSAAAPLPANWQYLQARYGFKTPQDMLMQSSSMGTNIDYTLRSAQEAYRNQLAAQQTQSAALTAEKNKALSQLINPLTGEPAFGGKPSSFAAALATARGEPPSGNSEYNQQQAAIARAEAARRTASLPPRDPNAPPSNQTQMEMMGKQLSQSNKQEEKDFGMRLLYDRTFTTRVNINLGSEAFRKEFPDAKYGQYTEEQWKWAMDKAAKEGFLTDSDHFNDYLNRYVYKTKARGGAINLTSLHNKYAKGGAVKTHYAYGTNEDDVPDINIDDTADYATTTVSPSAYDTLLAKYQDVDPVALQKARADARAKQQAILDELATYKAQQEAIKPDKSEMYFRLAQAFLTPGKTGSFGESLAQVGATMADYQQQQAAQRRADAAAMLQLGLKQKELLANMSAEDLAALEARQAKIDANRQAIELAKIKASATPTASLSEYEKVAKGLGLTPGTPEFKEKVQALWNDAHRPPASSTTTSLYDDETVTALAERYLAGDKTALTGMGRSPSSIAKVQNRVTKLMKDRGIDPTEIIQAQQNIAQQSKVLQGFASTAANTQGGQIAAMNMLTGHIAILNEAASALSRNDIAAFNRIKNVWEQETNQPLPNNLSLISQLVGDELQKAAVGGAGGVEERKDLKNRLYSAGANYNTIKEAAEYASHLASQRVGVLKQQWNAVGLPQEDFNAYLTPATLAVLSAKTSPPPRPANVPANAGYSPSQHKWYWKDSSGKTVSVAAQ